MKQAAASVPGGVDEIGGIDHQRIALPFTDREPIVIAFDGVGALSPVGRNISVFVVPAPVIGILVVEEDDVCRGLDNARWRALAWKSQRLTGHDWIVLVR